MQRPLIHSALGIAILVLDLLAGSSASAAVVLQFDPPTAAAGARVTGSTGDSLPIAGVVYLAPSQRVADKAAGANDERLVRFGRLRIKAGAGMFTGTVPHLAPGEYVAITDCREGCAASGLMITVGEFRVAGSPLASTGRSITTPLIVAALLALVGSVVAFRPLSKMTGIGSVQREPKSQ